MNKLLPPGLTEELIENSVILSMNKLTQHQQEMSGLYSSIAKTMQSIAPVSKKLHRIHLVRDRLSELVSEVAACRKGCDHCCKMAVGMSSSEAAVIGKHLGISPVTLSNESLPDRYAMVHKYMGVPCPFLTKGQCSIYEVRPSACRTHYNISAYPDICNVIDYPGNDVPSLNFQAVWNAEAMLMVEVGDAIGDIREFFPDGDSPVQSL